MAPMAARTSSSEPQLSGLEVFHPALRKWFVEAFAAPTPAQSQAWPVIAQGEHALLLAPTGSGKTLAAFLVAIDRIMFGPPPPPKPVASVHLCRSSCLLNLL